MDFVMTPKSTSVDRDFWRSDDLSKRSWITKTSDDLKMNFKKREQKEITICGLVRIFVTSHTAQIWNWIKILTNDIVQCSIPHFFLVDAFNSVQSIVTATKKKHSSSAKQLLSTLWHAIMITSERSLMTSIRIMTGSFFQEFFSYFHVYERCEIWKVSNTLFYWNANF